MKNYEQVKVFCIKNLDHLASHGTKGFLYKDDLLTFLIKNGRENINKSKKNDLFIKIIEDECLFEKFIKENPLFLSLHLNDIIHFYGLTREEYEYLSSFNQYSYPFDECKVEIFTGSYQYTVQALCQYGYEELKNTYKDLIDEKVNRCHLQIKGKSVAETEVLLNHIQCFFEVLRIEEKTILVHGNQIDADVNYIPNISKEEEQRKQEIETLKNKLLENKKAYQILENAIDTSYSLHKCSGLDVLLNYEEQGLLEELYNRFSGNIFYGLRKYKDLKIIEFLEYDYKFPNLSANEEIRKVYHEDNQFKQNLEYLIYQKFIHDKSILEILNSPLEHISYAIHFFDLTDKTYKKILVILKENEDFMWVTINHDGYDCYLTFWSDIPDQIDTGYGGSKWGLIANSDHDKKNMEYQQYEVECNYQHSSSCLIGTMMLFDFIKALYCLARKPNMEKSEKMNNIAHIDEDCSVDSEQECTITTKKSKGNSVKNKNRLFSIFHKKYKV